MDRRTEDRIGEEEREEKEKILGRVGVCERKKYKRKKRGMNGAEVMN